MFTLQFFTIFLLYVFMLWTPVTNYLFELILKIEKNIAKNKSSMLLYKNTTNLYIRYQENEQNWNK